MDTGRSWDVANPTESQAYSYDFVNDLNASETINSVTFALTVFDGTDNNPSSHLSGDPGITGTIVTQRVQYLTAGVTYILAATVTTSQSNIITLSAKLPCQAIG